MGCTAPLTAAIWGGYSQVKKSLSSHSNKADMTEYEKMLSGEIYNAVDPSLLKDLYACSELCWEYNQIRPTDFKSRNEKLKQILGEADDDTFINPPFHCDYGKHIKVGRRFFANFNFVVLDEAPVTIGDDVFIGPNVGIYTACHSTDPKERNTRKLKLAKNLLPILICFP